MVIEKDKPKEGRKVKGTAFNVRGECNDICSTVLYKYE